MKIISLFEKKQMTSVDKLLNSYSVAFHEMSVIKNKKKPWKNIDA